METTKERIKNFFVDMLDHIDKHEEEYSNGWSNDHITRHWIVLNQERFNSLIANDQIFSKDWFLELISKKIEDLKHQCPECIGIHNSYVGLYREIQSADEQTTSQKQTIERLREVVEINKSALQTAIATIRAHNGIGMTDRLEKISWDSYQASPEMKIINNAVSKAEQLLNTTEPTNK